jgi:hypothetical protein
MLLSGVPQNTAADVAEGIIHFLLLFVGWQNLMSHTLF